jgi:uncharacterized membrane protein YphA (DoxX/SURF4 family)
LKRTGSLGWTAIPVFILELVCGGFLMLGLLSRWAAAALIPVTIDSLMVHWPHGWMFDWQGGRRTKDTLEYDREINAQSAVGCDS